MINENGSWNVFFSGGLLGINVNPLERKVRVESMINENGSWNVLFSGGLLRINVIPLERKINGVGVPVGSVNAMFVRNNLPKFGTDLATAHTGRLTNINKNESRIAG